jgi:preprotein translocase subunit SecY
MIEGVRNIFKIPDLRKRVLYTFLLLAVYRIGANVPTPGINTAAVAALFAEKGSFFSFIDMFSGRALSNMTVFALGIMPYISASIILQLLTVVWPYLEKLSKEGEVGRKKITQYTRYGTVILSILQSAGIAIALERTPAPGNVPLVPSPGWGFRLMTIITLTTGTAFIMWLGEQISDRGIGNGISLIIFAGIVVGFAPAIGQTIRNLEWANPIRILQWVILIIFMVAVVAFIVFVERGQRRFPVQYAKRVMGRRMYGGQSTHLPLKVNTGGVIPVIFASSIIILPQVISKALSDIPFFQSLYLQTQWGQPLYNLIYITGIIFFCYFYTSIIFNPIDVADNMRKYGGYIPGIRPGKNTADFIDRALSRITFGGALYLAAVAILPEFLISGFKVQTIPFIGEALHNALPRFVTNGFGVAFYFGGTSLLIVVGVAMDTVQQIESQLIMRHYDGFLKGGVRIRGRR